MSTGRFISLLVCGLLAAAILSLPEWMTWWNRGGRRISTEVVSTTRCHQSWESAGWGTFVEKTQMGSTKAVTGEARLFSSYVIREATPGMREQMHFAEIEMTNNCDSDIKISSANLNGFFNDVRVFEIKTLTAFEAPFTLKKGESCVLRADGTFLPLYLLNTRIQAFVWFEKLK